MFHIIVRTKIKLQQLISSSKNVTTYGIKYIHKNGAVSIDIICNKFSIYTINFVNITKRVYIVESPTMNIANIKILLLSNLLLTLFDCHFSQGRCYAIK